MIETYLSELARAICGPAGLKRDLLTEARHSLLDAAEAYECRGVARAAAERRAIAEFGDVAEVAPAYQAELGLAQGRRTALLVIFVLLPQGLIWAGGPAVHIGRWYSVLEASMAWTGGLVIVACGVAALAAGRGARQLGPGRPVARATGLLTVAASAFFAVSSIVLAVLGDSREPVLGLHGLPLALLAVVLPMGGIALSARRTLLAAG